jgi:hypothetical protein
VAACGLNVRECENVDARDCLECTVSVCSPTALKPPSVALMAGIRAFQCLFPASALLVPAASHLDNSRFLSEGQSNLFEKIGTSMASC